MLFVAMEKGLVQVVWGCCVLLFLLYLSLTFFVLPYILFPIVAQMGQNERDYGISSPPLSLFSCSSCTFSSKARGVSLKVKHQLFTPHGLEIPSY